MDKAKKRKKGCEKKKWEKEGKKNKKLAESWVAAHFLLFFHYSSGVAESDCSALSGTGDSQRDSRESIRANHSQLKPLFL